MSEPGDFLAGIDPISAFRADVEADVAVRVEQLMIGDVSNWKPEGLANVLGIEPEHDTLAQAKASGCHRADTCILDDACPFIGTCREADAS